MVIKIEDLIKRQNLILSLLILFFSLIVAKNIYKGQIRSVVSLEEEIKEMERKEATLREIQILEKGIEEYKEKFKKLDISSSIEEFTKYARICGIKVSSIRPGLEIVRGNFIKQPIIMELLGNYHSLGKFLALLEKNFQVEIQQIQLFKIEEDIREAKDLRIDILVNLVFLY